MYDGLGSLGGLLWSGYFGPALSTMIGPDGGLLFAFAVVMIGAGAGALAVFADEVSA